jgi:Skp family chaperone for outer membrane proteins
MSALSGSPLLPSRCPACKGAVIQRMPGRTQGAFVWFYCFFCNHTWKHRLDDVPANPDGELTGDVFVVSRTGKKHSLASVVLNAIPEDELNAHLEHKTAQRELERAKLQREIDALSAALEEARAEEDRLWNIQKRDEENSRKAKAWSVAFNKTKILTRELEDLQARRQHLTSGEYFFRDIPSPISSAKTDAEGKFTLVIPRNGRYGIVARASRELGEGNQSYFWFVWVSLEGEASKRLLLNDDNIVGVGSPDSALG